MSVQAIVAKASPTRTRKRSGWGRLALPYLLIAPAFAFLVTFTFWPVLYSIILSTLDWRLGFASRSFVGVGNYLDLFASRTFQNALRVTLAYTFVTTLGSIVLGLLLALAIHRVTRLQAMWQALFFLPVASTMAAMAVVFRFMFDTRLGVVNEALLLVGWQRIDWFNGDASALFAVILVGIWSSAGYAMVLFLAGLTTVPRQLYDSAAIDGANGLQQLRWIMWPMLSPTTIFVVVIITLRSLENFDSVKVLTDGGPLRATQVLSHLLYLEGFRYFETGYASALATVFFVMIMAVAFLQMRAERRVHYE
jgi:multiple sugar transport system permease protein